MRYAFVAEHRSVFSVRAFAKYRVGGDDDRCAFIEFADQMEQELSICLGEWQVAQFFENQEIETGDQIGGPALPVGARLGIQLVDQIDNIEEPSPGSVADTRPDDTNGQMGFAGSGAADQDQIALMIQEVSPPARSRTRVSLMGVGSKLNSSNSLANGSLAIVIWYLIERLASR